MTAVRRLAGAARQVWWLLPVAGIALAILLVLQFLGVDNSVGGGGGNATAESTVQRDFDISDRPQVVVDTFRGDVTIQAAEGTRIGVSVRLRGAGGDRNRADQDLRAMLTSFDQDGTSLHILTRAGRSDEPPEAGADVQVTVPAGASVSVISGGGTVEVSGVRGNVSVANRQGDILVRVPAGQAFQVDASGSVDSDVDLQRQTPPAGFKVRAVSGPGPTQFLTLNTSRGGIKLERAD